MRRTDCGFTLLEMMVSLVLAGLALAIAGRSTTVMRHAAARLHEERAALDARMNGYGWLRETFRSVSLDRGRSGGFEGRTDRVVFSSYRLAAAGLYEVQRVGLEVVDGRLMAQVASEDPIVLRSQVEGLALDYLLTPGERSEWVREWVSPAALPLLVRLRLGLVDGTVDTLLFAVASRG